MALLAIFGALLIISIVCICCYCLKEKNADDRAKEFYYKNVQKETPNNQERVKLIENKKTSITAIRVSPRSPKIEAKNLKPMNVEMTSGSFADKVLTVSANRRQQRIWGEK